MTSSIPRRIPASADTRVLKIPVLLWRRLLCDLRKQSQGARESGAFLLGEHNARCDHVLSHVLYNDLDPQVSDTGIIRFSSSGYPLLWRLCRDRKQRAIADVHTHPESWVGQSDADRAHPMIPERGHISLIVPSFGYVRWWSLRRIGVHEYLGGTSWKTHASHSRAHFVPF